MEVDSTSVYSLYMDSPSQNDNILEVKWKKWSAKSGILFDKHGDKAITLMILYSFYWRCVKQFEWYRPI